MMRDGREYDVVAWASVTLLVLVCAAILGHCWASLL